MSDVSKCALLTMIAGLLCLGYSAMWVSTGNEIFMATATFGAAVSIFGMYVCRELGKP